MYEYYGSCRSRDSSVGIATHCGLDGPGIESRWGEIFHTRSDRLCGPPSLLYNGYRVFPGDKAAGACRWPPTPSSAEFKERVELYLYSRSWAIVACSRVNFTFTFSFTLWQLSVKYCIVNVYIVECSISNKLKNRLYPAIRLYEHFSLFSFEELTLLVCPYIVGTPCINANEWMSTDNSLWHYQKHVSVTVRSCSSVHCVLYF